MKTRSSLAVMAGLFALTAGSAFGQQPAPATPGPAGTLAVSQVKLANGLRASKLIGASVYNEANEKIGTVDDLILSTEDKAVVAVIQVGGFLGAGGKLVAVPYTQLRLEKDNKVVMAGATKDELNALPSFTYSG